MSAPRTKLTATLVLLVTSACAHSVRILTVPAGANVTIDGRSVGSSPVLHYERSGWPGDDHTIRAELPGYVAATLKEEARICPTPANLILDSLFGIGLIWGFCMRDEYILELSQTHSSSSKP